MSHEVPMVELLVNVRDKAGRFVRGMRAEEFRVFEDGTEQKVALVSDAGTEQLTVGLLIDTSGSRRGQMPGAERDPAKRFFRETLVGKNLGFVVTFGERVYIDSDVTADFAQLDRAIDRGVREQRGSSALFDAVYAACERASAGLGRRALVVITDGEDNYSRTILEAVIEVAQRTQTMLYVVRVQFTPGDPQIYPEFLSKKKAVQAAQRMADATGGICFTVAKEEGMSKAFLAIAEALRTQYSLVYVPTNAARDGTLRRIEIRTTRKDVKMPKGRGYYAAKQ